jgi:hypothetical protein
MSIIDTPYIETVGHHGDIDVFYFIRYCIDHSL